MRSSLAWARMRAEMNDAAKSKVELVRGLHEAFREIGMEPVRDALVAARDMGDAAARLGPFGELLLEVVDPDVRIEVTSAGFSLPDMPTGTKLRGWDGWLIFWRGWLEPWEDWWFEIGNFETFGDNVVLDLQVKARGRGSSIPVDARAAQVWTVRDGKIAALAVFDRRHEAEQAAQGAA
jgi:hypothetical protein